ncbi:hypothetical protein ACQKMI_24360 [Lysinibacillus sp. NPDC097214]|uniref:hypothetical protein n=1 Tax=Lysinibacillus sp. NPDC097214 TaxID=3390584 RepID=UPI003D08AD3F
MGLQKVIDEYCSFRTKKGIHLNTIDMEVKYIKKFHASVNIENKQEMALRKISYKDVEGFFRRECEALSERTVYRKITILVHYFDFLWRNNYIPMDFMSKFRVRFKKLSWEAPPVKVDYHKLLERKEAIYDDLTIKVIPKFIYLLMTYGIEMRDMLHLSRENIIIHNDYCLIYFENVAWGTERSIKIDSKIEQALIKDILKESEKRGINLLLSTKSEKGYGPYNPSNLHDMMKPVSELAGCPLNSTKQTMYAFVHYLVTDMQLSIESVSDQLAIPLTHSAKLVKTSIERIECSV